MASSSTIPSDVRDARGSPYLRHTPEQTARLEELFKQQPTPDENQRRQIAQELKLDPKQIKFWFQNKRTKKKAEMEREQNDALRDENFGIQMENFVMIERLKDLQCPSCGGSPYENFEEHKHSLEQLKLENARMKDEIEKARTLTESYTEKLQSKSELQLDLTLGIECSHDPSPASIPNLSAVQSVSPNPGLASDKNIMPKAQMIGAAIAAKDELVKLLTTNEPLWVKSPTDDQRLILHPTSYERLFPRVNPLIKSSKAREESSKGSRIVGINPKRLIDIFIDSNTWTHIFPTIISKAHTIQVVERGSFANRSGALLLMYEDMHVLSPLVPSREFYFLRYCAQIEDDVWVITDVSFDYLKEKTIPSLCWRLPSGCLIRAMPNGCTEVTWVEHVEVDDNIQTHSLYKDVVSNCIAYGAERWLSELSRMCNRLSSFMPNYKPCDDAGAVINVPEGRKGIIKLSHRMVKSFSEMLNMSKTGLQRMKTSAGVWISVNNNIKPGQGNGRSLVVATSFWVPNPLKDIFHFFIDAKKRFQWDFHWRENNPPIEVSRISNRPRSANFISVFQETKPTQPRERAVMIQETFVTRLGSYIVYAPIKVDELAVTVRGHDSSKIFLLPSGITISELAGSTENNAVGEASSSRNHGTTRGSLVTIALQIEMSAAMNSDSIEAAKALVISTAQKIKDGLNFCDLAGASVSELAMATRFSDRVDALEERMTALEDSVRIFFMNFRKSMMEEFARRGIQPATESVSSTLEEFRGTISSSRESVDHVTQGRGRRDCSRASFDRNGPGVDSGSDKKMFNGSEPNVTNQPKNKLSNCSLNLPLFVNYSSKSLEGPQLSDTETKCSIILSQFANHSSDSPLNCSNDNQIQLGGAVIPHVGVGTGSSMSGKINGEGISVYEDMDGVWLGNYTVSRKSGVGHLPNKEKPFKERPTHKEGRDALPQPVNSSNRQDGRSGRWMKETSSGPSGKELFGLSYNPILSRGVSATGPENLAKKAQSGISSPNVGSTGSSLGHRSKNGSNYYLNPTRNCSVIGPMKSAKMAHSGSHIPEKGSSNIPHQLGARREGGQRSGGVNHLPYTELMNRKAKGLCFRCGEKFHPIHQCKEKQFRLVILDDDERINEEGEVIAVEVQEDEDEDVIECNTLGLLEAREMVKTVSQPTTMKIKGNEDGNSGSVDKVGDDSGQYLDWGRTGASQNLTWGRNTYGPIMSKGGPTKGPNVQKENRSVNASSSIRNSGSVGSSYTSWVTWLSFFKLWDPGGTLFNCKQQQLQQH